MQVDFKITTWERVIVPNYIEEEVLSKIKAGIITSSEDLFTEYDSSIILLEELEGVSEQMTVEENGGSSTIEAFNDKYELIYSNETL